jgi:hypothetical protein
MFIYTLSDPITKEVRYIGKTNNIKTRFFGHMKDKSNCHRTNWINSLKSKNLIPSIDVLDECDESFVNQLEIYWIAQFKAWGFDLTNNTDGGDSGYKFTDEVKTKMSKDRTGKKQSKETIEKRIAKVKKPILQYDLEGNFIKKWEGMKDAASFYNIKYNTIILVLKGRNRKAAGYQWKLYTEDFPQKIDAIRKIIRPNRRKNKNHE